MKIKALRVAFSHTVPVLTGYLFLGFAYGLLMHSAGFSAVVSVAMSLFVYAGSMQYAAVPLLCAPFAPFSALMLALMVNARHIFYGVSMLDKYRSCGKKEPYLVFALTDETFSLNVSARIPDNVSREDFYFFTSLLDHCYWVAATLLGGILGKALTLNTQGIEFVMTALFVTVFTGQWMESKEHRPALIGLGASALCLFVFGAAGFILPAMALMIAALLVMRKPLDKGAKA
ncbi:MAG: AzlC family ABC transporter permease [Ruthenibacterium sp.]